MVISVPVIIQSNMQSQVAQDQGPTSLQIPQRQMLPSTLPRYQSFAAMAGQFRGGDAALGGLLHTGQTPSLPQAAPFSEPLRGTWTTLNSSHGSDAFSGATHTSLGAGGAALPVHMDLSIWNKTFIYCSGRFRVGYASSTKKITLDRTKFNTVLPGVYGTRMYRRTSREGLSNLLIFS